LKLTTWQQEEKLIKTFDKLLSSGKDRNQLQTSFSVTEKIENNFGQAFQLRKS
jgi:hypothetical protein